MENKKIKAGITVFPGSNCDADVYRVLNSVFGVNASFIWHNAVQEPRFEKYLKTVADSERYTAFGGIVLNRFHNGASCGKSAGP